MKRQNLTKLKAWKDTPTRKPLLLMGARQVGKTTLLQQFGELEYQATVSLNFDDQPRLKALFEDDLSPQRIIRDISLEFGVDILPEKTLLIFDEIQECPNALNSLKYFNENAREYHVCGAGSLLGVKLAHTKGFPVGNVHFQTLYPLSFIEFLQALEQKQFMEYLQSLTLKDTINEAIHTKLLQYLKQYLLIGGMPEAVDRYIKTEDFTKVREVHDDILKAYELDFIKHSPAKLIPKITECFHAITSQLAKENKKFIYSVIRQGARARDYDDAIQWLVDAGIIHKVYNTSTPKLPLKGYENRHVFKTYALDVGLLNTMANLPIKAILDKNRLFQEFHGSLTENFVVQELTHIYNRLHYWTSSGIAEIDFILQTDDKIIPLEVKSGQTGRKKSLLSYGEKYKPEWLLRTSPQNLDRQNSFINIPLYLVGQLSRLL